MSEEKALSSEKNTAERPAPFAAMKNEVEFTSGMESASEQEQKKAKSILLEIESELNAYDRATGLKKIAFSRNFHIRPDLLEKIRLELRGYYYVNGEINKLHKQLYAKGNKLIELASA